VSEKLNKKKIKSNKFVIGLHYKKLVIIISVRNVEISFIITVTDFDCIRLINHKFSSISLLLCINVYTHIACLVTVVVYIL
jgi:hypothetical protein